MKDGLRKGEEIKKDKNREKIEKIKIDKTR